MTVPLTALVGAPERFEADGAVAPAILVVDDNPSKRLAIKAMLAPLGHDVVEANSGREALRAVLRETFALILMDVRMPTMDGYETAKLIRQRSQSALTPIIFVTAFGSDETETAAAYASGAVDFVFTPIRPEVLRAKVSAFVDLHVQSCELARSLESITVLNTALRDSEVRIQTVLDNVTDGIFVLDENGIISSTNRSVSTLFGYHRDEPIGQPFEFVIAPERKHELRIGRPAPEGSANGRRPTQRATETLGRRCDRSTFPMEVESGEMKHGDRHYTLAVVRDISERKAHLETLEHQALHDDLTGLANRTLFSDHVSQALASAKRSDEPRAVLVMDLNGFKQVNDRLGHDSGNLLLTQVGTRLVGALREIDKVARLGGDEFAILPGDSTDLAAAAAVAWKIEQLCDSDFLINGETAHVSASVGIALFPQHGTTTADLLRRADLAMYDAKRSASGHAVFDAAHEKQLARHLALLVDLRQCVARDELVLHYQPKIDMTTRRIFGVEALIRWHHPEHGLMMPGAFLPELERIELIAPVTQWVINDALRQQQIWRQAGFDLDMAVNISAQSLSHIGTLPEVVAELTTAWDTAPDRLTLELTEGALIAADAPDVLARLHDTGVRVSIDDFGTGYSSLSYLQRLPVDEIKIDRSFVTSLVPDSDNEVIVRSTIDLAHNLGLTVVGEGVEDENVVEMLAAYGCDSAQGYFFSRPCAAPELTKWLTESSYGPSVTTGTPGRGGDISGPQRHALPSGTLRARRRDPQAQPVDQLHEC
jgi:diguanylate cyclase (GGDEF)-like protein/PAS domain S-box-containing protein